MSLLEVRHISKSFRHGWIHPVKREVLHDISFSVEENEILGLAGTSGAGKTTLIRIIMQLLKPDAGEVVLNGDDLSAVGEKKWKEIHRTMQLVFQNPASSLNPRMSCFLGILISCLVVNCSECAWRGCCCFNPDCSCWTNRPRCWMYRYRHRSFLSCGISERNVPWRVSLFPMI